VNRASTLQALFTFTTNLGSVPEAASDQPLNVHPVALVLDPSRDGAACPDSSARITRGGLAGCFFCFGLPLVPSVSAWGPDRGP